LYQSLLGDSRFFDLLLKLDADLAAEARRAGCACGGVLHSAHYERKPRGGPADLAPGGAVRFSLCCATEGCRRRTQPASLRFLGRKVYFAVVVLLVPVLREGLGGRRHERLRGVLAVSVRTVRRWRRFWRETFPASRSWRAARGRFAIPHRAAELPGSLLGAFCGIAELEPRVVAVLRLVVGGSASAF
jgi:hypothetical protein